MSVTNEQIVDAIATKSLMEVMDLVKAIEEKFGVSAAAPVMAAGPAAAGGVLDVAFDARPVIGPPAGRHPDRERMGAGLVLHDRRSSLRDRDGLRRYGDQHERVIVGLTGLLVLPRSGVVRPPA